MRKGMLKASPRFAWTYYRRSPRFPTSTGATGAPCRRTHFVEPYAALLLKRITP